jgi:hypothetical protein
VWPFARGADSALYPARGDPELPPEPIRRAAAHAQESAVYAVQVVGAAETREVPEVVGPAVGAELHVMGLPGRAAAPGTWQKPSRSIAC